MRRLSDGQREVLREIEADARECEEALMAEMVEAVMAEAEVFPTLDAAALADLADELPF